MSADVFGEEGERVRKAKIDWKDKKKDTVDVCVCMCHKA